jgi:hypothetical protein
MRHAWGFFGVRCVRGLTLAALNDIEFEAADRI